MKSENKRMLDAVKEKFSRDMHSFAGCVDTQVGYTAMCEFNRAVEAAWTEMKEKMRDE